MFGAPAPVFSDVVVEFDSIIEKLTWNDGNTIVNLTSLSGMVAPSDAMTIVATVEYRIIHNLPGAKLPVLYVLDSLAKNVSRLYGALIEESIVPLFCALFDVTSNVDDRERMRRLFKAWCDRGAFQQEKLQVMAYAIESSMQRRSLLPVPSGWPAIMPPGTEHLPGQELSLATILYKHIFPREQPTLDELNFTKDAVAVLNSIAQGLKPRLGRPTDIDIAQALILYENIKQQRMSLLTSNIPALPQFSNTTQNYLTPMPSKSSIASPSSALPTVSNIPQPQPNIYSVLPSVPVNGTNHNSVSHNNNNNKGTLFEDSYFASSSLFNSSSSISSQVKLSYERDDEAISELYDNIPYQCSTCGIRFNSLEDLDAHNTQHYNERLSLMNKKQSSRQWNLSSADWISTCGGTTAAAIELLSDATIKADPTLVQPAENVEDNIVVISEEANSTPQSHCPACGEALNHPVYDSNIGWYYSDAVRGEDNLIYHLECSPSNAKKRNRQEDKNSDFANDPHMTGIKKAKNE